MEHIVIGIKENFKTHAYIMLYSLLKNNMQRKFFIHILSDNLNISYFKPLEKLFECRIELYLIDISDIKNLNFRHIDVSTFYRLKIDQYLPQNLDKVLYLDTDIIVSESIDELLDINFSYNELAAVVECKISTSHLEKIGFKNEKYFNAGMIYFNYKRCIEEDVFKKALKLIIKDNDKYNFMDQDVLNKVLKGKLRYISPKWNYGSFFSTSELLGYKEIKGNPVIIHYTGILKPWNYLNTNKYGYLYFKYYREIFSENVKIEDKTLFKIIKKYFILFIFKFYFTRKIIIFLRKKYRK